MHHQDRTPQILLGHSHGSGPEPGPLGLAGMTALLLELTGMLQVLLDAAGRAGHSGVSHMSNQVLNKRGWPGEGDTNTQQARVLVPTRRHGQK